MNYDLAIIGAGPGGYVSALRAAKLGKKVALIEKDAVGGTCLNRGCIPTKVLAGFAEKHVIASRLGRRGNPLTSSEFTNITKEKDKAVLNLQNGILSLLKNAKADLINGSATLVSNHEIEIKGFTDDRRLATDDIIIAVGSQCRPLPGLNPDGQRILSSDHLLELKELPKSLLIVGGGVIGCEFASIMNAFGVSVAIVEMAERLLPLENPFVGRLLARSFKKRGIEIHTNSTVENLEAWKHIDKILVSVGRKPSTENLGLEKIGVETKNGYVLTDKFLRTNVENIYAIGDSAIPKDGTFKPPLAHVASNEGLAVIAKREFSYTAIPRPIFTKPEIACVGVTTPPENARTGRFSYTALSKAVCDGETEGAMEVYVSKDDLILGAAVIGAHATDICAEVTLARQCGLTADKIINTVHAHPTYSEIIVEALEDAYGMAVHKSRKVTSDQ